jgi:ribosomal-protein-alanine N-acetyltransferase
MIETEKLKIIPLHPAELDLYLQGEGRLEKLFGLRETGRMVAEEVRQKVSRNVLPGLRYMMGTDYLFNTFWIVVDKASNSIVAELGFKGRPDRRGAIEIGHGTMPSERRKGIMTEAVGGMVRWAQSRPEVNCILAETEKHNKASIRVLEKNLFVPFAVRGNMKWWKREVSTP